MLGRLDSVAGIVTGARAERSGVQFSSRTKYFPFFHPTIETESRSHPAPRSMGTGVISRWVKRQIRDSNTSPPSAQFKHAWRYTSTLPMRLRGVAKNNFPFSSVLVLTFANGRNSSYDMAKMDGH